MINDHLSLSQQGLALLKQIETLRLKPYDDQTGRPIKEWTPGATIGYGHLIAEIDWPKFANGIDKSRANEGLENRRDCEWNIWQRGIYQRR